MAQAFSKGVITVSDGWAWLVKAAMGHAMIRYQQDLNQLMRSLRIMSFHQLTVATA